MNSTIQSLIVGVILLIVVFYVIHKIFKMVRNRKSPTSACCGCNKPCKVEKIDKKRQKKNKLEYWKIEKYNIPLHSQSLKRIRVPWPSGQAPVCKTVYSSSNLLGTSIFRRGGYRKIPTLSPFNRVSKIYDPLSIFRILPEIVKSADRSLFSAFLQTDLRPNETNNSS